MNSSVPLYRNPVIVHSVRRAVSDLEGLNVTMKGIRSKMSCYELDTVPSQSTISRILHEGLGYTKKSYDPAVAKYNAKQYDSKRRQICREIVHSLIVEDVVICIDESSFSTNHYSKKKW